MQSNIIQPRKVSLEAETKGTKFRAQLITFYEYLKTNVCTASMVSDAIGISQKNICRHKRHLEKVGLLWQIEKKYCYKSKFKAWNITTNPELMPISNQLKLF
jgi:predicted transcriptional regulator